MEKKEKKRNKTKIYTNAVLAVIDFLSLVTYVTQSFISTYLFMEIAKILRFSQLRKMKTNTKKYKNVLQNFAFAFHIVSNNVDGKVTRTSTDKIYLTLPNSEQYLTHTNKIYRTLPNSLQYLTSTDTIFDYI